jgi:hypothetical protein
VRCVEREHDRLGPGVAVVITAGVFILVALGRVGFFFDELRGFDFCLQSFRFDENSVALLRGERNDSAQFVISTSVFLLWRRARRPPLRGARIAAC